MGNVKKMQVPFFDSTLESRTDGIAAQSAWGIHPFQKILKGTLITGDVREGKRKTARISSYGIPIATSVSLNETSTYPGLSTQPEANRHAFGGGSCPQSLRKSSYQSHHIIKYC